MSRVGGIAVTRGKIIFERGGGHFMRQHICVLAILFLSACARPLPPEQIAAAKSAAEQQFPLTPALRNNIATAVRLAKASKRNAGTFLQIQNAEISQLKVGQPDGVFKPEEVRLSPYYCVRVTFAAGLSTMFVPTKSYARVTVLKTGSDQYMMSTLWTVSTPPVECVVDVNYQPFPELGQD
jgi:hypothetical protein